MWNVYVAIFHRTGMLNWTVICWRYEHGLSGVLEELTSGRQPQRNRSLYDCTVFCLSCYTEWQLKITHCLKCDYTVTIKTTDWRWFMWNHQLLVKFGWMGKDRSCSKSSSGWVSYVCYTSWFLLAFALSKESAAALCWSKGQRPCKISHTVTHMQTPFKGHFPVKPGLVASFYMNDLLPKLVGGLSLSCWEIICLSTGWHADSWCKTDLVSFARTSVTKPHGHQTVWIKTL